MTTWRGLGRRGLEGLLARLTGRHPLLLPREASDMPLLEVRAPYRVEGPCLSLEVPAVGGQLTVSVLGYVGHTPQIPLATATWPWAGGTVSVDVPSITLRGNEHVVSGVPLPTGQRRFAVDLSLRRDGHVRTRRTSHYVAAVATTVDASYYHGANYVDHDAESHADLALVRALVARHGMRGRLLEIGAATGTLVSALRSDGFSAVGVDFSPWAVAEAERRHGAGLVVQADVDREVLPAAVTDGAPFDVLLLMATFEHFHAPFDVLDRLRPHVAPGGWLVLRTTNADSLTHRLFGRDWEGFVDWTHHGVEQVSADRMRRELPARGWEIVDLRTDHLWDASLDPTHATLRQWYAGDARFRTLLAERDLGDFVTVVARRT